MPEPHWMSVIDPSRREQLKKNVDYLGQRMPAFDAVSPERELMVQLIKELHSLNIRLDSTR